MPTAELFLTRADGNATPLNTNLTLFMDSFTYSFNAMLSFINLPSLSSDIDELQRFLIDLGFKEESIRMTGIVNEQVTRNGDANVDGAGVPGSIGSLTGTNPHRADLMFAARTQWNRITGASGDPLNNNNYPRLRLRKTNGYLR